MQKYKQVFQEMLEYNSDLFTSFKTLHDNYALNSKVFQTEFNDEGEKVLRVIRRYENILCTKSENGRFGKFSTNLSEKFWGEVKQRFPKIGMIGKE